MRRHRSNSGRQREEGLIIILAAVFLLFVVGAMAALSIDVVALYAARSEAQLAADGAALAGARVLANSGITSSPASAFPIALSTDLAKDIATQVARQNQVGGKALTAGEVTVTINDDSPQFNNPVVTVQVKRTDLPTFFARIWGRKSITVAASARAEAYNPEGLASGSFPVAPLCVKPWLLPNIDPTQAGATGSTIFNVASGAITNPALIGQGWPNATPPTPNSSGLISQPYTAAPAPGAYYAGAVGLAADDFPAPTQAMPRCSSSLVNSYQLAIAGCVPRPIACGPTATASVNVDTVASSTRDADTESAVECLIHYSSAAGDTDSIINSVSSPSPPFHFLAGNQNPITSAFGKQVVVSDSLVTVPVFDSSAGVAPTVTVIGFLQLFLNPNSTVMPPPGNQIPVTIVNMVGCGTNATGTPIYGNGSSAVAVRLITPP